MSESAKKLHIVNGNDLPLVIPDEREFDDKGMDFLTDAGLESIGRELIQERPDLAHLLVSGIAYLWKKKGGKRRQHLILGQVTQASGLVRFYSEQDFIVWLAADHLREQAVKPGMISRLHARALIHHELLHLGWDAEKGQVIMVGHEFEGFLKEIEVYGLLNPRYTEIRDTMKQLKLL